MPDYATILSAVLCVILVIIIDVKDLIGFTDISGFLTYSTVAMGLLVVRYYDNGIADDYTAKAEQDEFVESSLETNSSDVGPSNCRGSVNVNSISRDETSNLLQLASENSASTADLISSFNSGDTSRAFSAESNCFKTIRNRLRSTGLFKYRQNALGVIIFVYLANVAIFGLMHNLVMKSKLILILIAVGVNLLSGLFLTLFEQTKMPREELAFKTPLVPLVPILAIVVNTYLMMASEFTEWLVFAIVLLAGKELFVNFIYIKDCYFF